MANNSSKERSLADRLFDAQVASCSCLTKTPAHEYHDPMCRSRLFYEAWLALSNAPETKAPLTGLNSWSLSPYTGGCQLSLYFESFESATAARERIRQHFGFLDASAVKSAETKTPRCWFGGDTYGHCELEEGHDGPHKITPPFKPHKACKTHDECRKAGFCADSWLCSAEKSSAPQSDKCEHGIPRRFCTAVHDDPHSDLPVEQA